MDHDERKKLLCSVMEIERNLTKKAKQGLRHILKCPESKRGPLADSFNFWIVTRKVHPTHAFQFVIEILNISGLGEYVPASCSPVASLRCQNPTDIGDIDGMRERCLHVRIFETLSKNSTWDEFRMLMDNGTIGCSDDDNPYVLFETLERQNSLDLNIITDNLRCINECKLVDDIDRYRHGAHIIEERISSDDDDQGIGRSSSFTDSGSSTGPADGTAQTRSKNTSIQNSRQPTGISPNVVFNQPESNVNYNVVVCTGDAAKISELFNGPPAIPTSVTNKAQTPRQLSVPEEATNSDDSPTKSTTVPTIDRN